MYKQKIKYLLRSILNFQQTKKCPFCGNSDFKPIDRKYIFTVLLKCNHCALNHRHPKDDQKKLAEFYQQEYSINTHMMTKLPSDEEIQTLKQENFPSLRSYDNYIEAIIDRKAKIVDYGCSWGYNVFKLQRSGYDAVGYEISRPRAAFGKKKLGIYIYSDTDELPFENDLVLSSHVIEHLSDIDEFIQLSKKLLHQEGFFMTFCPNGSTPYKDREPAIWHINWGNLHPNYLTVEFAQFVFKDNPYLILTGDWEFDATQISNWDGVSQITSDYHAGKELLIISKPNINI